MNVLKEQMSKPMFWLIILVLVAAGWAYFGVSGKLKVGQ